MEFRIEMRLVVDYAGLICGFAVSVDRGNFARLRRNARWRRLVQTGRENKERAIAMQYVCRSAEYTCRSAGCMLSDTRDKTLISIA